MKESTTAVLRTGRSQFIMMFFAFAFGMILSNLIGQQANKKSPEAAENILLTYRGIDKTIEDLPEDIASAYRTLDQQTELEKQRLLSSAALQLHLNDYAVKQQLELQEAAEKLFQMTLPTEEEVNRFYNEKAETIRKPFYQVKPEIEKHLTQLKAKQVRREVLAELIQKGDLAILPDRLMMVAK